MLDNYTEHIISIAINRTTTFIEGRNLLYTPDNKNYHFSNSLQGFNEFDRPCIMKELGYIDDFKAYISELILLVEKRLCPTKSNYVISIILPQSSDKTEIVENDRQEIFDILTRIDKNIENVFFYKDEIKPALKELFDAQLKKYAPFEIKCDLLFDNKLVKSYTIKQLYDRLPRDYHLNHVTEGSRNKLEQIKINLRFYVEPSHIELKKRQYKFPEHSALEKIIYMPFVILSLGISQDYNINFSCDISVSSTCEITIYNPKYKEEAHDIGIQPCDW